MPLSLQCCFHHSFASLVNRNIPSIARFVGGVPTLLKFNPCFRKLLYLRTFTLKGCGLHLLQEQFLLLHLGIHVYQWIFLNHNSLRILNIHNVRLIEHCSISRSSTYHTIGEERDINKIKLFISKSFDTSLNQCLQK